MDVQLDHAEGGRSRLTIGPLTLLYHGSDCIAFEIDGKRVINDGADVTLHDDDAEHLRRLEFEFRLRETLARVEVKA